jgi:hypothetical protein
MQDIYSIAASDGVDHQERASTGQQLRPSQTTYNFSDKHTDKPKLPQVDSRLLGEQHVSAEPSGDIPMASGKWTDPTFPRTNWKYREYRDSGDRTAICEACESRTIRFQHLLTHETGLRLWMCAECGGSACPYPEAIQEVEAKLTADALERASRTIIVRGTDWLETPFDWHLPIWSPLELQNISPTVMVTLVPYPPFPPPIAITFRKTTSGGWQRDEQGDCSATLYAVASYKNRWGTRVSSFPNIRFGAVLLRDEDIAAINTLTHGKPHDYIVMKTREAGEGVWREMGAATYKPSLKFLVGRAAEFIEGRNWKLDTVMHQVRSYLEDEPCLSDIEDLS